MLVLTNLICIQLPDWVFSKMLSKKLDFYANPFENPKLDTDFVRSEVGK